MKSRFFAALRMTNCEVGWDSKGRAMFVNGGENSGRPGGFGFFYPFAEKDGNPGLRGVAKAKARTTADPSASQVQKAHLLRSG